MSYSDQIVLFFIILMSYNIVAQNNYVQKIPQTEENIPMIFVLQDLLKWVVQNQRLTFC